MRKVLLNSKKSKNDVNNINIIPIEFNRDYSLFQDEKKTDTIDILQLYNDEKNASTKHRLIFTINPICSNVLFNRVTEIVYKEGSDDCQILNNDKSKINDFKDAIGPTSVTRYDAIRNSEYSNDKFNLTYHCGTDIFNNHLLRKKENISVQKPNSSTVNNREKFNTIEDYSRNFNGDYIKEYQTKYDMGTNTEGEHPIYDFGNLGTKNMNIYNFDTIYSFLDGYKNNISRSNGWVGFYNPSTLRIPVSGNSNEDTAYYVNKCINNVEPCQFVDMAPERDLFFFTPKKNLYRHRLEHNWDYCLTYPYECVYEDNFNILSGYGEGLPLTFITEYSNNNSLPILLFYSPVKHNLKVNDTIKITYDVNETSYEQKCSIVRVGNFDTKDSDRYFSVIKSDFFDDVNGKAYTDIKNIRFVKLSNGYECNYYFRKFKKITYDNNRQPQSVINKLAFAKNIYGDDISQLVFTEDIDIDGLEDNLGRPLTELYLTVIKRNQGYKKWYQNNVYKDAEIEYSHVFGEVTSGIDISAFNKENNINYPSIRMQHNITDFKIFGKVENEELSSKKIETDITIEMDEFYGDLVEFNPVQVKETVLEPIKHRFNTAQREIPNNLYSAITYDEITGEDKDGIKITKYNISGNTLDPEGYIYNPHHKVKIGEFSDNVYQKNNPKIWVKAIYDNHIITSQKYDIVCNDKIIVFDDDKKPIFYVVKRYYLNDDKEWEIELTENFELDKINSDIHSSGVNQNISFIFRQNREVPKYAYFFPKENGLALWRDYVKPSNYPYDSDLNSIPFTNGAFYHHSNITFPVQRQDPDNEYRRHLFKDNNSYETNNKFYISSSVKPIDFDDDYVITSSNGVCF